MMQSRAAKLLTSYAIAVVETAKRVGCETDPPF